MPFFRQPWSVVPILVALASGNGLCAQEPPAVTVAFIDRYCASCHNDADLKGRLDLTSLAYEPASRANFAASMISLLM